jgi:MFS family permease
MLLGNLIILPLALVFGRRPVFLCSILGLFLATIGAAVQNSYEAHLAARIIQGLTTGATESLLPLIITEITFVHQRSLAFGFYWATQSAFSSLLNLASSYETASLSWRWYYWVYVFTIGFGFVTAVFGTFETRFKRPAFAFQGQCIVTDEFGVTRTLQGDEATAFFEASQIDSADMDMTRKSYIQKLTPYSGVADHPARIMFNCWLNMLKSLSSPGIVYALLLSAAVLGCAVGVSLTYNTVLQEIYGWPAANVGLINIGGVIGAFLGMAYAGWPADKYTVWLARRNGGIHKPEHRLLMLPLVGIVGLAALLLYGFTASGNATWWGPYIGWTLYQFCFVSILIVTTSFAAESWPQDPGPALVMVVGAKNIIAFGVSYGLIPMIAKYGYKESLGILAGVHTGIFLLGIPTYYLNPMVSRALASRHHDQC